MDFGSKAETLEELIGCSTVFHVPSLIRFSTVEWECDSDSVLNKIMMVFGSKLLAVRSSAYMEDSAVSSQAGVFVSCLDVNSDDKAALEDAINSVIFSYKEESNEVSKRSTNNSEVFVQEMVTRIDVSGVILTRCVDDGSPYYVFSYDEKTGSSNTVTSGKGGHKTVMLYRQVRPEHCDSPRLRVMLALAREMELIFPNHPLDIEFALDLEGNMHLLQVRPIATVRDWHPDTEHRVARALPHIERFITGLFEPHPVLLGKSTLLGNMPDWNPAELLGKTPTPLATSLFRSLISSGVWHQTRATMGYRKFPETDLVVLIAGHVYVDVRASFNSFLPEKLPSSIGKKLVDYWIQRLSDSPELHDKIEFELVPTVLDFDFNECLEAHYSEILTESERSDWRDCLLELTRNHLRLDSYGTLAQAEDSIDHLSAHLVERPSHKSAMSSVAWISQLISECREMGTRPFSILARHAFVAESLLRSAVKNKVITEERLAKFKSSITTVMGDLSSAMRMVCNGKMKESDFLSRFGHLRPSSFDILSPCYRKRPSLFSMQKLDQKKKEEPPFCLSDEEKYDLNQLLDKSGLLDVINAEGVLEYASRSIRGREYGKFIFTRHLSAILEEIAAWGEIFSIGRNELSYLRIEEILDTNQRSSRMETVSHLMQLVDQARLDRDQASVMRLSYMIRGVRDVYVVPVHRSEPTFITRSRIEGPIVRLKASSMCDDTLDGRIVCIENADPGFDWVFTRGLAGLVTQYGGANSHMAIRCAELQLPAAIGCGEILFEELNGSQSLLLDCASRRLEVM